MCPDYDYYPDSSIYELNDAADDAFDVLLLRFFPKKRGGVPFAALVFYLLLSALI
jgi:hypothetical protein